MVFSFFNILRCKSVDDVAQTVSIARTVTVSKEFINELAIQYARDLNRKHDADVRKELQSKILNLPHYGLCLFNLIWHERKKTELEEFIRKIEADGKIVPKDLLDALSHANKMYYTANANSSMRMVNEFDTGVLFFVAIKSKNAHMSYNYEGIVFK